MRFMAFLVLFFGLGCVGDEGDLEAPAGRLSESIYVDTDSIWDLTVSVCWRDGGFATEKAWVRDAIETTWGDPGESSITFTNWGNCGSADIEIEIVQNGAGAVFGGLGNDMTRMELPFTWTTGPFPADQCFGIAPTAGDEGCIRAIAVHEFGHALGFAHEQNRPDDPGCWDANQGSNGDWAITPFDWDSVMNYCSWPFANGGVLSQWDSDGLRRTYGFPDEFHNTGGWCRNAGQSIHIGDFDGNGHDDLLCHSRGSSSAGDFWIDYVYSSGAVWGTNWSRDAGWCKYSNQYLYVGDFNGDGHDDLLCHSKGSSGDGDFWIDYADASGHFMGTNWSRNANWCKNSDQRLYVGDFNGDGRDDLLCHSSGSTGAGDFWIDFADGSGRFNGTNWSRDAGWCKYSDQRLYIGEFNGDRRDDLLCHNNGSSSAGDFWVDYANASGHFWGTNWSRDAGWCKYSDQTLYVGDFDGDNRDDLMCHNDEGSKWFDFSDNGQFNGTNWNGPFLHYCRASTDRIHVGYFDGDNQADLVCHNVDTGRRALQYPTDFVGTGNNQFRSLPE